MDFKMESTFDDQNARWNVSLSGEVEGFNAADLKQRLTDLIQERDAHLYINCAKLEFVDSTALGAMVGVMKTVKSNGKEIHLQAVRPNFIKILRITNLDKVFVVEGES